MEYRNLGCTGLKVSPLCLGAMMFGEWGNPDHDDCVRIVHRALDTGINFIDTANVYSHGESEKIVGKAIKGRRDQVVLATKVHGGMGPGPNDRGNSRVHIMREVENSLRRLGTDYIDLYQIHRPECSTPIEETLRALDDLIRAGKVRYIGSTTFPAWQLVESYWVSDRLRINRFVCEQPPYSILVRAVEKEVFPACQAFGTGVIPWSPLAGGRLSGRYRRGEWPPKDSPRAQRWPRAWTAYEERKMEVVEQVLPLAAELGVSLARYATAWTLMHPAVTSPIIGPRTMEQLEDLLPTAELRIPAAHLRRIDELVSPGTNIDPNDGQ